MRKTILILTLLPLLTLTACNEGNQEQVLYQKISQQSAKELMDQGHIVIDVRESNEYNEGHIENAMLIPLGTLESEIETIIPNKDEILLIYCRSGNRSKTASNILIELGYTEVYDFGGIIDWEYGVVN